jgi:serine/threonine-protein kinase
MGLFNKLGFLGFSRSKKAEIEELGEGPKEEHEFELTNVGPYKIVAPIGSGGMGTVYKALDPAKDVTIAIKVLDRRYDLDKKRRKQDYLGREIKIAAALDHPTIIKMGKEIVIQEDNEGNLRRCLLMEYIDGFNLTHYVKNDTLTLKEKINMIIRLAEGLDFLHQNGVVHRDIKPANFLFSRDGSKAKICDFGLSKSNASWRMRFMKEAGGTRAYMSPEQLNKQSLDARSDIFSFGITMFEFFTGRHPCTGESPKEIARQLRSSNYKFPRPSSINSEIPDKLDRIILKALRRDINKRYQSCTEMLLDLTRLVTATTRI